MCSVREHFSFMAFEVMSSSFVPSELKHKIRNTNVKIVSGGP
jgi:hypothetical protein